MEKCGNVDGNGKEKTTDNEVTFKSLELPISLAKHSHVFLSLILTDPGLCVVQHDPNSPPLLIEHKLDKVFLKACVSSPQTHRNDEVKTIETRSSEVLLERDEYNKCPPLVFLEYICVSVDNEE